MIYNGKREEIIFLYDAYMTNPNGDPIEDNRPRIYNYNDESLEIVTDVRLKRTIRDFINNFGESDSFLKQYNPKIWFVPRLDDSKKLLEKEKLIEQYPDVLSYTDMSLFGATLLGKHGEKKSKLRDIYFGPVQFRFGISMNNVNPLYIKGTTVMPSSNDKKQGTFTDRWVVDYSLISFYGVINENSANDTGLNDHKENVDMMLYAMWNGIKSLITQSKVGETPRLLMVVEYKESNYQIGNIDRYLKLNDRNVNSADKVSIDVKELISRLKENRETISGIYLKYDSSFKYFNGSEQISKLDEYMRQETEIDIRLFGFI